MTFSTKKMNTKINLLFFFLCITFYSFAQKGNQSIKAANLNNGEEQEQNNIRAIDAQTEDKLKATGKSEIEEKGKNKVMPDASAEEKKKEELKLKYGADSKEAIAKYSVSSKPIIIPCSLLSKWKDILGDKATESINNLVILNQAYASDYNLYSLEVSEQMIKLTQDYKFDENTSLSYIIPYLGAYKSFGIFNSSSLVKSIALFFKANPELVNLLPDYILKMSLTEEGIMQIIDKQNILLNN